MGTTIGIDEGNDVTGRMPNAEIARRAGAGLQFTQQSRTGIPGDNMRGSGSRAVIDNNDFEEATCQALSFEAAKAGVEGFSASGLHAGSVSRQVNSPTARQRIIGSIPKSSACHCGFLSQ